VIKASPTHIGSGTSRGFSMMQREAACLAVGNVSPLSVLLLSMCVVALCAKLSVLRSRRILHLKERSSIFALWIWKKHLIGSSF